MPTDATAAPRREPVELQIEGELSIYRADELKRALIEPLQKDVRLVVNLASVTELDTCGLQLLMLAKRTAAKLGGELQLVAHSPAVLEVFELLNVAAFFGDHLVIPPSAAA
jgi:anti-anti-sigma factor